MIIQSLGVVLGCRPQILSLSTVCGHGPCFPSLGAYPSTRWRLLQGLANSICTQPSNSTLEAKERAPMPTPLREHHLDGFGWGANVVLASSSGVGR